MGFFDEDDRKFNVGDRVKVKYREQEGYITDINGDLYTVSLDEGMFIESYYEDELDAIVNKDEFLQNPGYN